MNLQVKSPPASIHVPVEKRTMQNVNIPPFKVPPGHIGTPPGHISIPVKEPPYGKIGKADCKPPPSAPLDQGYMQITPGGSNSMPPLTLSKGGLTSKGIPPPPHKQHSAESAPPAGSFHPFDVEAWMHLVGSGRPPTREERDELRAAGHVIPKPPTESVPKPKPTRGCNRIPPLTEPVNVEMPWPLPALSTDTITAEVVHGGGASPSLRPKSPGQRGGEVLPTFAPKNVRWKARSCGMPSTGLCR